MIQAILYFTILCLIYQSSEFAVQLWVEPNYWFLAGWIIGLIVAMLYKEFADRSASKDIND
jgi:hypothetical protein